MKSKFQHGDLVIPIAKSVTSSFKRWKEKVDYIDGDPCRVIDIYEEGDVYVMYNKKGYSFKEHDLVPYLPLGKTELEMVADRVEKLENKLDRVEELLIRSKGYFMEVLQEFDK